VNTDRRQAMRDAARVVVYDAARRSLVDPSEHRMVLRALVRAAPEERAASCRVLDAEGLLVVIVGRMLRDALEYAAAKASHDALCDCGGRL
jgi:hypothetical protein